jgi:hypothetical protein
MRFHKPFDDVQWEAAAKTHAQMRSHLAEVRRHYSPKTAEEERLLRKYRDAVQEFGRELLKPPARIDSERLNDLVQQAATAFVDYVVAAGPKSRGE